MGISFLFNKLNSFSSYFFQWVGSSKSDLIFLLKFKTDHEIKIKNKFIHTLTNVVILNQLYCMKVYNGNLHVIMIVNKTATPTAMINDNVPVSTRTSGSPLNSSCNAAEKKIGEK